jgi:hypothetical protein
MVSEDFELVDFAAEGQVFRGPQGIRQWLQIFLTALPDLRPPKVWKKLSQNVFFGAELHKNFYGQYDQRQGKTLLARTVYRVRSSARRPPSHESSRRDPTPHLPYSIGV